MMDPRHYEAIVMMLRATIILCIIIYAFRMGKAVAIHLLKDI